MTEDIQLWCHHDEFIVQIQFKCIVLSDLKCVYVLSLLEVRLRLISWKKTHGGELGDDLMSSSSYLICKTLHQPDTSIIFLNSFVPFSLARSCDTVDMSGEKMWRHEKMCQQNKCRVKEVKHVWIRYVTILNMFLTCWMSATGTISLGF